MIEMIVNKGRDIRELNTLTPDHMIGKIIDIPALGRLAKNPDICDIVLNHIARIEERIGVLTFELDSIRRTALTNMRNTRW